MSALHTLDNDVAMDKVGTDPCRVEDGVGVVQEHNTYDVVANVTLLVYLVVCMYVCVCVGGGRGV